MMLKKVTSLLLGLILLLSTVTAFPFSASALEEADNTALLTVLGNIESYEEADYTPASFAPVSSLYAQYAPIAEAMDEQSDIDAAVFQLLEAVAGLKAYLQLTVSSNIDGASVGVSFGDTAGGAGEYTVVFGDTVTLTAPEINGYILAGWIETVSRRILSDASAYTFPMSVNTSLQAFYLRNDTSAIIFTNESGQVISVIEKTPQEWADYDSLDEFLPAVPYHYGYTNGRWVLPNNAQAMLAQGEFVYADLIYDPVDTMNPAAVNYNDDTVHLKLHYHYDGNNAVGSFIMTSYLPNQVRPESVGMLFYYKKSAAFNPAQFDVNINNKMLVSQYDTIYDDTYITNMKKFTSKYNWAVKGYVTYYENGVLKTAYSNQVNIVNTVDLHHFVETSGIEPTCTEPGYTRSLQCEICGIVDEYREEIPPLGHSYTEVITPPTCTENGYITKTCSVCGNEETVRPEYDETTGEYTHPELLKTEHQYGNVTITTPATLEEIGEGSAVCTVCGDETTVPVYVATGSCGDNLTYTFDHRTGALTISGSGAMDPYELIADSPFSRNADIKALTVGEGVTKVTSCAFYGCTALEGISLPSTLTEIQNRAFYGCTALLAATIPNSVTKVGYHAFYGCSSMTELHFLSGNNTTELEEYAFASCSSLTNLTIPSSVTSIGNYCFSGNSALTQITVPATVTNLGDAVFQDCTGLNTAVLADGIHQIPTATFSGCSGLQTVTLPADLLTINASAFRNCTSLSQITLDSPLSTIGDLAFYGCSALTNLTIPNTVLTIGTSAFTDCSNLVTDLPSQISSLGSNAFKNCTALTAITVPSSLTVVPSGAFEGDTEITRLTLSQGIQRIGGRAFYGCSGLTSLTIPVSVDTINDNAFTDCNGLQTISVDAANTVYDSRNNADAIIRTADNTLLLGCSNTVIPSTVTAIRDYAFSGFADLQTMTVPASVTSIGKYAFRNCTRLQTVTLPSGLTVIEEGVFYGCNQLNGLTLPEGLTAINSRAFYGCSALTALQVPSSVGTIGGYAFSGCSSLTALQLPTGLETVASYLFNNCTSLAQVTLPGTVRSIGMRAFNGCSSITEIRLSEYVTSVGNYAFNGCSQMTDIYIYNISCTIAANAGTIPVNTTIHAYLSSNAKTYADRFGRNFVSLSNS